MKSPWEWTEQDLSDLIKDGIGESVQLEYKSSAALGVTPSGRLTDKAKADLSKDVSAMANSAGGTVVYGIVEQDQIPVQLDGGIDPNAVTKEAIENIITSGIQRKIDGVVIHPVQLPATQPGKVAYVVCVPQSERAPHMASDHRFYKRYNFKAEPMEEYEVRDVANRASGPLLSMWFNLPSPETPLVFREGQEYSDPVTITVRIRNDLSTPAEYCITKCWLDDRLRIVGGLPVTEPGTLTIGDRSFPSHAVSENHAVPHHMPVWNGIDFGVTSFSVALPKERDIFALAWQAQAPRMQTRTGITALVADGEKVQLIDLPTEVPTLGHA